MKIIRTAAFVFILFLLASPVYADSPEKFIEDEIAEWTEIAVNNGFNILETYSGEIGVDNIRYQLELTSGVYHFYSSGGTNVQDLDLHIYGIDGYTINSDSLPDKIPIVVIMLAETATVDVEINAWSFEPGNSKGLFCILVTCEDEGEILSMSEG